MDYSVRITPNFLEKPYYFYAESGQMYISLLCRLRNVSAKADSDGNMHNVSRQLHNPSR